MRDLRDTITHFSLGVVTSGETDRADLKHALVRADNAQFTKVAARIASIRKRFGLTLVNSTPLANTSASAGPALTGGQHYIFDNAGTEVRYSAQVSKDGTVTLIQDDGSSTNHAPVATFATVLTANTESPVSAVMNNRLFVLDGLGGKVSIKGTSTVTWGVSPATINALADGGAGNMSGDYDIVITALNTQTGAESEISEVSSITLGANKQLNVTANAVAVGLTHMYFRIYIRKPAEGPGFFRVLAGTGYVGGTTQGFPLFNAGATTTVTINVSDATLEDLILTPPAVGSRGLPPSGIKYIAVWANRLFVADDSMVYWSEQDLPDAFNPLNAEPIRSPNGGHIKGMKAVPIDEETSSLSVWTLTARHELTGTVDPTTWDWDVPDPELGLVSNAAALVHDGVLAWWAPDHGPVMRIPGGGEVTHIGNELVNDQTGPNAINTVYAHLIRGVGHGGRMIWAIPEPQKTRLTKMVVFNTEMRRWESTHWDPMDIAALFVNYDSSSRSYIALGGYNGQLFRLLKGTNDGIRAGTTQGTFVAAADSILSISDAGAAFDTTGARLIERKVTILGPDGLVHGSVRPYITANTATSITLNEAITGLTVGQTYTYLIGGQNFAIETYWWNFEDAFTAKRWDKVYLQFRADSGVSQVIISTAFGYDPLNDQETTTLDFTSEHWDTAFWDLAFWDSVSVLTQNLFPDQVAVNARIQLRNPYPDQGFEVLKIGLLARELGDALV
jgi:hypothetical protein